MNKKSSVLPLSTMLYAIDKKDRDWYNRLTKEEKTKFSPFMLQRYVSNTQGDNANHFLWFTNHCTNYLQSDIPKEHKELLWLLFTAISTVDRKVKNHNYLKPPNAKKKKNKISKFLSDLYPHLRTYEIEILLSINSKAELKELAIAHGYDDKQIRDIFGKV